MLQNDIQCNTLQDLLTLISLKRRTPHKEATIDGPVVTIGNATGIDNALFAINQQLFPIAHMTPDTKAGIITFGYTFGLNFITMMYVTKKVVLVKYTPQKSAKT